MESSPHQLNNPENDGTVTVIELPTQERFDDFIKAKGLSILHFYTPWLAQCAQVDDILQEMSKLKQYGDVKFAKINAEAVPEASLKFDIAAVPVVLFMKDSIEVDRLNGANAIVLTEKIKHHAYEENTSAKAKTAAIKERLELIVNQAPCMLFMKGTPADPRCGYSRKIIAILDNCAADYKAYDILKDNEAREGLKKLYNWPTYPQLYLNGELIGGLDIVQELNESGDLKTMLPKKNVDKGD